MRGSDPFADLVELPENRLALTAVRRLPRSGSLVTLHGPPGTGKSLLVQSMVKSVARGAAARTVRSLPANDLDEAEHAELAAVDVLAIEDLQHLPASAVAELSRLLDARLRRRRPTLLTANDSPARLMMPRTLLSRIVGGLVVAIEPLSPASRAAVLRNYAEKHHISLADDAFAWLAARATGGSVRPLLGTLDALKARHPQRTAPLTLDQVRAVAGDVEPPGVEQIVAKVAARFGVMPRELLGPSRLPAVSLPRQVAMFLARDLAALSLPRIGAHFGGRDHSTVQHAVNRIRGALAGDRQLAGTIRQLKLELA